MDFKQLFGNTDAAVKLEFLHSILIKNDGLRNQFIEYCKPVKTKKMAEGDPVESEKIIIGQEKSFQNELECLDFEKMDWREYVPRHGGYIEEYEAYEHFAEDQLTAVFAGWKEIILSYIKNGQLVDAVCKYLGAYDACLSAEIKGSNDIFEDLTDTLQQYHQEIMDGIISEIEYVVKSDVQVILSMEAVFNHYKARYEGMRNYLKYFEPLLISLTENIKTADQIIEKLKTSGIDESWLPRLTVKLYSFKEGNKAWISKAEKYLYADLDVAKQLLGYYWLHDAVSFMGHGKRLFHLHPDEFCDFFRERLYPLLDRDFFRDVLWHQAMRDRNPDLYEELREYLNEDEKQRFINGIKWDVPFKIRVLEMEKKYEDILHMVQKDVKDTWYFTELVRPILTIYPNESFDLIKLKISFELAQSKKRSEYSRICNYLKLATLLPQREAETRQLVHELYNRRPALPALKDEMRKAGVVE